MAKTITSPNTKYLWQSVNVFGAKVSQYDFSFEWISSYQKEIGKSKI